LDFLDAIPRHEVPDAGPQAEPLPEIRRPQTDRTGHRAGTPAGREVRQALPRPEGQRRSRRTVASDTPTSAVIGRVLLPSRRSDATTPRRPAGVTPPMSAQSPTRRSLRGGRRADQRLRCTTYPPSTTYEPLAPARWLAARVHAPEAWSAALRYSVVGTGRRLGLGSLGHLLDAFARRPRLAGGRHELAVSAAVGTKRHMSCSALWRPQAPA
jgi:hypothetical protein